MENLKSLIDSNPSLIQTTDKDGYTPLHRACYNDNLEIVDYLLIKGADVSAKTNMLWQPLHSCCQWNRKECALRLMQNGADVNAMSEGGNNNNNKLIIVLEQINYFRSNTSSYSSCTWSLI